MCLSCVWLSTKMGLDQSALWTVFLHNSGVLEIARLPVGHIVHHLDSIRPGEERYWAVAASSKPYKSAALWPLSSCVLFWAPIQDPCCVYILKILWLFQANYIFPREISQSLFQFDRLAVQEQQFLLLRLWTGDCKNTTNHQSLLDGGKNVI